MNDKPTASQKEDPQNPPKRVWDFNNPFDRDEQTMEAIVRAFEKINGKKQARIILPKK